MITLGEGSTPLVEAPRLAARYGLDVRLKLGTMYLAGRQLEQAREEAAFILQRQPNNLDAWAAKTLDRVRATGFKGLGAWSHPVFHKSDVPMTRDLNIWSWMHGPARRSQHGHRAQREQPPPLRPHTEVIRSRHL